MDVSGHVHVQPPDRAAAPSRPWTFLALALGWTWAFWLPPAALDLSLSDLGRTLLVVAGGAGPVVAALALLYACDDAATRADFWRRLREASRPGWRGCALALGLPVAFALLGMLSHAAETGRTGPLLAPDFAQAPLRILPFALLALPFGPLPEEMGWRGYGFDGLLRRRSAVAAGVIVGAAWAAWHLPLFFVPGTYQAGLGETGVWLFVTGLVPQSVLIGWIYVSHRRSTLAAVLFHYATNVSGELFALTTRAEAYRAGWTALAALAAVLLLGPSLQRRKSVGRA